MAPLYWPVLAPLGTSSDGRAEVLTVDGPLAVRDPPRPFMKNSRAQSLGGPLSRTQQGGGVFSPCDGPSQPLYTGTPQDFYRGSPTLLRVSSPPHSPCRTLNAELGVPCDVPGACRTLGPVTVPPQVRSGRQLLWGPPRALSGPSPLPRPHLTGFGSGRVHAHPGLALSNPAAPALLL